MRLQVIVGATRPGRAGESVARWFYERAEALGIFELEWIDLAEVNLPIFDEPRHPRLGQYEHEHTKRWSETIDRGDAYVFVTPEYNHSPPAALLNAIDFLSKEWAYKPLGIVSYGGVAAGTRSAQMLKQIAVVLKMMPIPEAVAIPMFSQHLKEGKFTPGEVQEKAVEVMLRELRRWAEALATLRQKG